MSLDPFLTVALFAFLGISNGLYVDRSVPDQQRISSSDDEKYFVVFPANGTKNSSASEVEESRKDLNDDPEESRKDLNDDPEESSKDVNDDPEESSKDVNDDPEESSKDLNDDPEESSKDLNDDPEESSKDLNDDPQHDTAANNESSSDYETFSFEGDASSACFVPELDTAEVRCKVTPSYVTCRSYCIYGYTYEEGIARTLTCKFSKNEWIPYFEECAPFVDCHLKLVTPGSLKCWGSKATESSKCEIECQTYEDKDALPKQVYKCRADGTWDPFIPFCVEPRGTKNLANLPGQVEHSGINYP